MIPMTYPDAFEETVTFCQNIAFIAYREPQTRTVYFSLDSIVPYFGFDSAELFLGNDYWLDELDNYRHTVGRLALREVWVMDKKQPTWVLSQAFLEQPRIRALWESDTTNLPVCKPQSGDPRYLLVLEQPTWSEDDLTYLLSVTFMDYGVPNQRTARLVYLQLYAFDARTPRLWAVRLQRLLEWATNRQRTEVHLSDLTLIERNRLAPPAPPFDTNFTNL